MFFILALVSVTGSASTRRRKNTWYVNIFVGDIYSTVDDVKVLNKHRDNES